MKIRVRGSIEAQYPPERGTVHISMSLEGPKKEDVVRSLTRLVAKMTDRVVGEHQPDTGPITWYSQGQLRNSAHRPWNKDGKRLPLVYTSTAEMKVKFSALQRLFGFIEEISTWEGVTVNDVEWTLTEVAKQAAIERAQVAAVGQASAKARRYAQAAGYSSVRPLIIADTGLLVDGGQAGGGPPAAGYSRAPAALARGSADGPVFTPEDVKIECGVEAEFEAGENDG